MNKVLKTIVPIVILAVGVTAMALLIRSRPATRQRRPEILARLVRVEKVERRDHRFTVSSNGTVAPRTSGTIAPEVSGKIIWKSASWANGGFFDEGDPLVRLEDREYRLARSVAEGQLAQAKLRLAREEEEAEVARREWETLGKTGDADERPAEPPPLLLRKPQLEQARAALEAARASVDRATLDLERTTIAAPYSGRFREILADFGDFVRSGTPIARIYATDYVEIRLPIPDLDIPFLDLPLAYRGEDVASDDTGPEVELTAIFGGARRGPWSGRIVRTEGEISARSRMVHAVARVENPYERRTPDLPPLAVGLFIDAKITGREVRNVAILPRHALRLDDRVVVVEEATLEPDATASENADEGQATAKGVATRGQGNEGTEGAWAARLRLRKIAIIRKQGETIVVDLAESELRPGELLCVSPLEVVTDGMLVRVAAEARP